MSDANVWGIENIANLDKLPPKGFLVYNMPLKFKDGSGSPVRVFATMGGDKSTIMAQQQIKDTSAASKDTLPHAAVMLATALTVVYST